MPRITPIKLLLVERRLIQADVAQAAGMSEYRLPRIVNGRARPTEAERKYLAQVLGMEREELPV